MQKMIVFLLGLLLAIAACKEDDSITASGGDTSDSTAAVVMRFSGSVGAVENTDENITDYIKALNLLFFYENWAGSYVLNDAIVLTKTDLDNLTASSATTAGQTLTKSMTVDSLPIGNYIIVGIANMLDSTAAALPNAELIGISSGATMAEVYAKIMNMSPSPQIFYAETDTLTLGKSESVSVDMILNRKVSMLLIKFENVPAAVTGIEIGISDTYNAFYANGINFLDGGISDTIWQSETYSFQTVQDSVKDGVLCMPTVSGTTSGITFIFTLDNGQVITITPPEQYTLEANTITQLTAVINALNDSGTWNITIDLNISANVTWNVVNEPDIEI